MFSPGCNEGFSVMGPLAVPHHLLRVPMLPVITASCRMSRELKRWVSYVKQVAACWDVSSLLADSLRSGLVGGAGGEAWGRGSLLEVHTLITGRRSQWFNLSCAPLRGLLCNYGACERRTSDVNFPAATVAVHQLAVITFPASDSLRGLIQCQPMHPVFSM